MRTQNRFLQMLFVSIWVIGCIADARAQDKIKEYVQQHAVPIRTIEPDSNDFSDLKPIGDAIGDARIVLLGEQDHGDAPTFLAKRRLIRYLHERLGFNVLLFESDFFALNTLWGPKGLYAGHPDSMVRWTMNPLWAQCDACRPLFYQYIPSTWSTSTPLELNGIDPVMNQIILLPALDSFVRSLKGPAAFLEEYRENMWPMISKWYRNIKDSTLNGRYLGYLEKIKGQIKDLSGADFWVQVIENMIAEDSEFVYRASDYWKSLNTRDEQMASNVKWLAERKYPSQKIVVWAHNYHVSKYGGHYPESFLNEAATMGTCIARDSVLGPMTYTIGFTSYDGTAGRLFGSPHYSLEKPRSNSFENWINKDLDYSFVDFKAFDQADPGEKEDFYMAGSIKGNMYHTISAAQWNRIFDGVFFIRHMYPCKRVQ